VLPHLGFGFEVWDDERLVHRHRIDEPHRACGV
jgi:hypothetical protein